MRRVALVVLGLAALYMAVVSAADLREALTQLCSAHDADTIVISGGVFQNELLLSDLKLFLERDALEIWTNHIVPANDGGISLGQAALAAFNLPRVLGDLDECDSRSVERAA
jgi:hydrogenase maturation factor HypF (carbamoyltransferase family)